MSENVIPGEAEAEARAQGWKPEEEWQGDKSKWMPAEQFLEVGQKVHKVQRDRMTRQLAEQREVIEQMRQSLSKVEERGYARALEDVAKKQRQAAEVGDVDAFDAAEVDRTRILKERAEAIRENQPAPPTIDPEFEDWKVENPWFDEDPDMEAYARGVSTQIQLEYHTKGQVIGGRKLYDEVGKRTKKIFAAKFTNPRREEPSSVEGGKPSGGKKGGKTFDDLPIEAKRAYEKFERQIAGFTKEEYLKNYVWE